MGAIVGKEVVGEAVGEEIVGEGIVGEEVVSEEVVGEVVGKAVDEEYGDAVDGVVGGEEVVSERRSWARPWVRRTAMPWTAI